MGRTSQPIEVLDVPQMLTELRTMATRIITIVEVIERDMDQGEEQ